MPLSTMQLNHEINNLTQYKYLDSLDTLRFREPSTALFEGRFLHAYADIFLALIMGDGIVVSNNQLIDSVPFIDVASQLIHIAKVCDNLRHLKIRARLYDVNSAFDAAQNIFGNTGYVLSGWPHLNSDPERRLKWSQIFKNNLPFPETDRTYFFDNEEYKLAKKLYQVLRFFDSEDGRWNRFTDAKPLKEIRENEIREIALMDEKTQEKIFDGLDSKLKIILSNLVVVFNRLNNKLDRLDRRSDIINALRNAETKKLNAEYFEKIDDPEIVEECVLAIVDCTYNYSNGIGTQADFVSHTSKPGLKGTIVPAVEALAELNRLTKRSVEGDYVLLMPDGILSEHSVQWANALENKEKMKVLLDERFSWSQLFQTTIVDTEWRKSLLQYLQVFKNFRECPSDTSQELEKKYLGERIRHMYKSSHDIADEYISMINDQWQFELKQIKGVDLRIENLKGSGSEQGDSGETRKEKIINTSINISGSIGSEVSITPKLTSEINESIGKSKEEGVIISSGKYEKQSRINESRQSISGDMSEILKVMDFQKYYTEQKQIGKSIKGVIATLTKNLI